MIPPRIRVAIIESKGELLLGLADKLNINFAVMSTVTDLHEVFVQEAQHSYIVSIGDLKTISE